MPDSLKYLISRLKQTKIITSEPAYFEALTSIDKFADNDFNKAYLLGHFFKYKIDSDKLPTDDKRLLIDTIKSKNLDSYYYLKTKPGDELYGKSLYLFLAVGLISIIIGTIQLIYGDFWYGLGTKYLVPIIREGGSTIIVGLVFLLVGLFVLNMKSKRNIS